MNYDQTNIFAKILRQEIPCKKISEDEYYLAFYDINPLAPIHALIICKGSYKNASDFHQRATFQEIIGFYKGIESVTQTLQLDQGYRLTTNKGEFGGQEVAHYHMHLLSGKKLGPICLSEDKG